MLIHRNHPTWEQVERFDPEWKRRIERMSSFIDTEDRSVVDVGCGPMWLREYLPPNTKYTGIDYKHRGSDMIVCDLNSQETPKIQSDVWFISGCLEYLDDPDGFISCAANHSKKCIISYCAMENFPLLPERMKRGWRNHLQSEHIKSIFIKNKMNLVHFEVLPSLNTFFVFSHKH